MSGAAPVSGAGYRKYLIPSVGSMLGVVLACVLFVYVQHDIERDAQLRFDRQTADAKHIVEARLLPYVSSVYGLRALFSARRLVTREEFHQFVASLDLKNNYPGFEVLNFARFIRGSEHRRLELEVRGDTSLNGRGYPDFKVKPPGVRDHHEVLIYLEPMQGNEFALGLDMMMVPAAKPAQTRAIETGEIVTSGRLLRIGEKKFVGLSMRLAVYRNDMPLNTPEQRRSAFIGTVGAGYNVRNLMAGVLEEKTLRTMRYRLYDVGLAGPEQPSGRSPTLLYDSRQGDDGVPGDETPFPDGPEFLNSVIPVWFGGRQWELHFNAPKAAFFEGPDARLPWMVLIGGMLLSTLLFVALYAFASSRERALALAREITKELRESEADLAHAQAQAHLGSWTLDPATQEMTWSLETRRLLHWDPTSTAPGLEAFLLRLREEDRSKFKLAVERCSLNGSPESFELGLDIPGESECWVHFDLQPVIDGNGTMLRGTIMDVTERKHALESQRASAAQIRDLLRRLVSVQEAERRGFSANLHDLVGQSLTVLGIGLETIRRMLPTGVMKETETVFNETHRVLKETMGSVRTVMSDLRPPLLDDYGLYSAVEWHVRQFQSRTGVQVALDGQALDPRPAREVELALFRIAQEALINVAKHASASQVHISITGAGGYARLLVEDNGLGANRLPAANDPGMGGWGIAVMHERAASVGGAMRIEHPGRGTRIIVEVGCDPHHPD